MASLNRVFLMGNLTKDPEIRYLPTGSAVCEFGLAMNRRFTVNGQEKDETCFVDIVVWGKQAESTSRYLRKGSGAFIEGRLQLDQWQDRETGRNRSRLRVVAERVQFLGKTEGGGGQYQQQPNEMGGQAPQQSFGAPQQSFGAPAAAMPSTPAQQPMAPQGQPAAAPQQPFASAPAAPAAMPTPAPVQGNAPAAAPGQPAAAPAAPNNAFEVEPEDDIPF